MRVGTILTNAQLKSCSQAASIFVILIGCIVIVGWIYNIPLFKSVVPGFVAMRPNTALGFILAGLSLTLRFTAKQGDSSVLVCWRELIGFGCSIVVFLLGGLTLIEYVFGWDLHIDQLLFTQTASTDSLGTIAPGRMAFSTALCFLISGLSLILCKVKAQKIQTLAQGLILFPALLGLVTLIGYAYGAIVLIGIVYKLATMALHTAVAFIMLSIGILLAAPNSTLVQTIFADTIGGAIARRLLPSIIIVPLVLGWLCLQAQKTGVMGTEFSVALLVLSNIVIFAVLVWLDAKALNQMDKKRKQAELELCDILPPLIAKSNVAGASQFTLRHFCPRR